MNAAANGTFHGRSIPPIRLVEMRRCLIEFKYSIYLHFHVCFICHAICIANKMRIVHVVPSNLLIYYIINPFYKRDFQNYFLCFYCVRFTLCNINDIRINIVFLSTVTVF